MDYVAVRVLEVYGGEGGVCGSKRSFCPLGTSSSDPADWGYIRV